MRTKKSEEGVDGPRAFALDSSRRATNTFQIWRNLSQMFVGFKLIESLC